LEPACAQCGEHFKLNRRSNQHRFCSRVCKQRAYRRRNPERGAGIRPKLTPDRRVQLVSLAKSGIKPLAIATEMKVNPTTVYRYMQAHNIKWSP